MANGFKKLMREQVQESLNAFLALGQKSVPQKGWIRTIRDALGMSSAVLAERLDCSRANITQIEQREKRAPLI
jgi:DNA-binding transcriptional regulator YiaG